MPSNTLHRWISLLVGLGSGASLVSAADLGGSKKPEPARSHVLFMGVDLDVPREKKYYRVQSVVGSEFKIQIGKKEFFVPTRNRSTDLKVSPSLKLSGASVRLDGLHSGPTYTTANDPVRQAIAASGSAGGAAASRDLAQGQVMQLIVEVAHTQTVLAAYPNLPEAQEDAARFQAALNEAERKTDTLSQGLMYDSQNNPAAAVDRMHGKLAEGNHDAMEVSFKISSPVELNDPHMVILFKFLPPGAKPGEEGMVIHAKALEPIGPKPKYIRVREGGLPAGFKFVDCTVHIYNRGQEIATNESPKRVELTRDEAQEYLVIEHIGTNKGATVPAIAVPGTLARDRLKHLTVDQINRTFYGKIAKDGTLLGVFADEVCHRPLNDPAVDQVLADGFFKPALLNGKPVDGVARLRLGEI